MNRSALRAARIELERMQLRAALSAGDGDRAVAQSALGVSRATLFRLLAKHTDIAKEFPVSPGPQKTR